MRRQRAVITVFFSLLSIVFLAGAFAVIEAVRAAGARAHCANASALGLWSVFSEYENILLEDYGLFAVDGGSGTEPVSKEKLLSKYSGYLSENESGTSDMSVKLPGLLLDPWNVSVSQTQIRQYALLTDRGGEYFYQQAVEYMRKTGWAGAIGKLKSMYSGSDDIRQAESEFEREQKRSRDGAGELERDINTARQELSVSGSSSAGDTAAVSSSASGSSGDIEILATGEASQRLKEAEEEAKKKNPLEKISSLQSKELLVLVCGRGNVSDKSVKRESLLSKRRKNSGVLDLDAPRGGTADDLLFREYLLDHFPDCSDGDDDKVLSYQLEYIIAGKYTDAANLRKVLKRLLILREGMNYSFLLSSASHNSQASALAGTVAGWTGKPAIVAAVKHALLLAWAYGESLFDTRMLLHGGRVPLMKDASSWNVPLDRLIDLESELTRADRIAKSSSGLGYKDFLRLLIAMTDMSRLKTRAMDLMEQNVRKTDGMGSFRADNCVIGMTVQTDWDIPPVFGKVPSALAGITAPVFHTSVKGGFAY